jgi:ribosomal protein S18 acetylase RimI-like enzyme
VEQAAVREAREETGLEVTLGELFGVYSFPEGPVQSGIIIFYRADPAGGVLQAGDDAADVRVFAAADIPDDVAFRTHREVIARWRERVGNASPRAALSVSIREASTHDQARVLELLALIPDNSALSPAQARSAELRYQERSALDVLVAEANGTVVGFVAVSFVPTLSGLRALINDMAVEPDFRRQGIGGALLEAGIQSADRRGATHLLVDTSRGDEATREFYRACGLETGGVAALRIR